MFKFIAFCAFVAIVSAFSCQPTVQGRQYNLQSLISPTGSWNFTAPYNGTNWIFQIQLCGPVNPQPVAACDPNSSVNLISLDEKECISIGDSNVYAWDGTPGDDGLRLTYFHGTPINDIEWYSSVIYIICNPRTPMSPFIFEHARSCVDSDDGLTLGGQFHLKTQTKLVC